MKIRLYSDLHIECDSPFIPPTHEEDKDTVLILAGDINQGVEGITWAGKFADRFRAIIYVLGNHEYYESNVDHLPHAIINTARATAPNIHVLNPGVEIIEGVRFVGGTLWTDFASNSPLQMLRAKMVMNDYHQIRMIDDHGKSEKLTPQRVYTMHKRDLKFILDELDKENRKHLPTVVVTHHLPTFQAIHPRYKGDPHNPFYASELSYWIEEHAKNNALKAWVFGHTHTSTNKELEGCKLLSNPYGYHGYEVNPDFQDYFTFEV